MTENSIKNNKALDSLNNKLLEIVNDTGILATYLMSPLSKITKPENTGQFRLAKGSSSNRINDLLIHNSLPKTLLDNFLTFCNTKKNNLN